MQLRVLGCHGGESPTHRATSFLIDGQLLIDAGSMTRGLSVPEQRTIDYAFISHAHLDHMRDLAMLADNIFAQRKKPVEVYCTDFTAEILEKDFFNNRVWPDFFNIPNPNDPDKNGMLRINRIKGGENVKIGPYSMRPILVDHAIECHGCLVSSNGSGTLCYSGDTGPTESLWKVLNDVDNLSVLILEVSFPNAMGELAKVSGHLTPELVAEELQKFQPKDPNVRIFLYGMKPGYHEQLKDEVAALQDPRLVMLKPMDEFDI